MLPHHYFPGRDYFVCVGMCDSISDSPIECFKPARLGYRESVQEGFLYFGLALLNSASVWGDFVFSDSFAGRHRDDMESTCSKVAGRLSAAF
jgi:hypothetical protein